MLSRGRCFVIVFLQFLFSEPVPVCRTRFWGDSRVLFFFRRKENLYPVFYVWQRVTMTWSSFREGYFEANPNDSEFIH